MRRIKFEILKTLHSPKADAFTKGVVMPLTANVVGEGKPAEDYHNKLRSMQQARTLALWDRDPPVFRTATDTDESAEALADQVCNCKAQSVTTHPGTRFACRRPKMCPYCWGRKVVQPFFWPLWRSTGKGLFLVSRFSYFAIAAEGRFLRRDQIPDCRKLDAGLFPPRKFTSKLGEFTLAVPVPATKGYLNRIQKHRRPDAEGRGVLYVMTAFITDGSFSWDHTDVPEDQRKDWDVIPLQDAETCYKMTRARVPYLGPLLRGPVGQHADLLKRYAGVQLFRRSGEFAHRK